MTKKHRPYLTEQAIFWITNTAKELKDKDDTNVLAAEVYKELAPLALKIEMGYVAGSYKPTPRTTLLNSLGGATEAELIDPLIAKKANYTKYSTNPIECSEAEVLDALDYKEYIIKELLTEEENKIIADSWATS